VEAPVAETGTHSRAHATLSEILPAYLESLEAVGKAAHTVASTRLDLQQLARFLGRQSLGRVSRDDLRAFFAWLGRQQGNRTSSLRRKTATVKGLFRHLSAQGDLEHDPAAELLYPVLVTPEATPLTVDEVEAIVGGARSVSGRTLILCLVDAGLKRDEVVALRSEDVEYADGADSPGRLHVRHRRATKRVKQRTLGLTERLAVALEEQLATTGPDDAESGGGVFNLSARGIDFIVEMCGRRAGVRADSKVTPKQLRDAYACARVRTFLAREAAVNDDPVHLRELRREHDQLLIRELGLAEASIVPDRYRRMVGSLQGDRAEQL
jgi:site-specific recombinase XerD